MTAWWESLSVLQRVFAYFALPATFVLIIQTILVLFGIGDNGADAGGLDADGMDVGGMDTDADAFGMDLGDPDAGGGFHGEGASDGLALLSIRGVMAFFAIGGWAGIVVARMVGSAFISVTAALVAGAVALYGMALLFRWVSKLQSAGNVSLKYAVGKTAKVYITIPGNNKGFGKVLLTFQGRFTECDAVSDGPDDLKSGELVRVVGLADADTLVVMPLDAEKNKIEVN